MAATTVIGTLNAEVEQSLTPRVDYWEKDLSPLARAIERSSSGVERPNWGQGWLVRKVFSAGLGGAFKFGQMIPPVADTFAYVAPGHAAAPNFNIYGRPAQVGWQGPNEATAPAFFQYQIPLIKGMGIMYAPVELRRVDSLNSSVADSWAALIDMTARKVALTKCNSLLAEQITSNSKLVPGILATLSVDDFETAPGGNWLTGTADNGDSAAGIPLLSGSIRRLADGLEVDLFWITGTTWTRLNTGGPVHCLEADGFGNRIQFVNMSGSTVVLPATTNIIYVVIHDVYTGDTDLNTTQPPANIPFGVERLLIDSGELYGILGTASTGIALNRHHRFRSYLPDAVGSALDEQLLFNYCARFEQARGGRYAHDTWWTTPGVFAGYVDGLDGYYTYERNDKPLQLNQGVTEYGGESVMKFQAFGRNYTMRVDAFIGVGKAYGLKMRGNNWKRYVPPRMISTVTKQPFDGGIEFVVPLLNGGSDIFQGAKADGTTPSTLSPGSTTDMVEAPFWMPYQNVADVPMGTKLTGIVETLGETT